MPTYIQSIKYGVIQQTHVFEVMDNLRKYYGYHYIITEGDTPLLIDGHINLLMNTPRNFPIIILAAEDEDNHYDEKEVLPRPAN